MKNLPMISGWEPQEFRDEAAALRRQADDVLDGKWCQHSSARDYDGESVNAADPSACTFCAGTHIDYFTPHPMLGTELLDQVLWPRRDFAYDVPRARHIPGWNDQDRRRAYQVARAFRAAAARAERYARILEAEQVPA